MKKRKKKVLVVEASRHAKILENIFHLLHERCELSFYLLRDNDENKVPLMFPSAQRTRVITNHLHNSTFFTWLIFFGFRYDYINISTGPEGNHFSQSLNVLCFYVCCVLYGKRMIVTVKNIRPYLRETGGVLPFIRSRAIKHVRRFTFETETMRDTFRMQAKLDDAALGVSYDRYTDVPDSGSSEICPRPAAGITRIGLLGGIVTWRRDYDLLIEALRALSPTERARLEFMTLGSCLFYNPGSREVIDKLSALVALDWRENYFSNSEFDARGRSCHLLLSPLKLAREYGTFKGSGSFGDAVYLQKQIIIPAQVDPDLEFKEIAHYYKDIPGLISLLKGIGALAESEVDPEYFQEFSTDSVFRGLSEDLKLGCGEGSAA